MHQAEVGDVVYVDLGFEHDDQCSPVKFDAEDGGGEEEVADDGFAFGVHDLQLPWTGLGLVCYPDQGQ